MRTARRDHLTLIAALGLALAGCDGKDPERLNRVGRKIAEKSRRFADDANLPRVTITRPKEQKGLVRDKEGASAAAEIPARSSR